MQSDLWTYRVEWISPEGKENSAVNQTHSEAKAVMSALEKSGCKNIKIFTDKGIEEYKLYSVTVVKELYLVVAARNKQDAYRVAEKYAPEEDQNNFQGQWRAVDPQLASSEEDLPPGWEAFTLFWHEDVPKFVDMDPITFWEMYKGIE